MPTQGTVLITVAPKDKDYVLNAAKMFKELGFKIMATKGTKNSLDRNGIESSGINKMHEGRPHIVDAVNNKEIDLIINTPVGKESKYDDSYIRKAAIKYKIPYITTTAAAEAAAEGIKAYMKDKGSVKSIQEYHKEIREIN